MSHLVATAHALWLRDLKRFFRQPSRVVGALGQPVVFWAVFGAGFSRSFKVPGAEDTAYGAFLFPGILAMTLLFTAIFSTVSVIEDRREGFLQAVLAGPAPRSAIALGKTLGGATLALIQTLLLLPFAPLAGVPLLQANFPALLATMVLTALAVTALSFALAWSFHSSQGFHAVMSILLIPMWILSGAMFPVSGASEWLGWLMKLNPMTWCVTALRRSLQGDALATAASGMSSGAGMEVAVVAGFCVVAVGLAMLRTRR
ncbi:MAG: ABC transporter permease [Myxococcota bacterium]